MSDFFKFDLFGKKKKNVSSKENRNPKEQEEDPTWYKIVQIILSVLFFVLIIWLIYVISKNSDLYNTLDTLPSCNDNFIRDLNEVPLESLGRNNKSY